LKTAKNKNGSRIARILNLFPFKSDLKRMSTVIDWDTEKIREYRCLCKGAPEILEKFFINLETDKKRL
jgi:cation-transporting ATPase 13A1